MVSNWLFYIGLGISGITLIFCLGYLGHDWRRRRKANLANLRQEVDKSQDGTNI